MSDYDMSKVVRLVCERDEARAQLKAAVRVKEQLMEALERIQKRADAQPVHVCEVAAFDLRTIADQASAALKAAKETP